MGENNENVNQANADNAIYSSKFLMNKDLFYDFNLISYNKIKKIFLVFLCFIAFETVVNIAVKNYDIVALNPFISLLMFLIYFKTNRAVKNSYARNLISAGKENILHYELFEDKIVSHIDELRREYFYNQITKFFETKNFILLHFQYGLYITLEKNSINANIDELKSFLTDKCTFVKRKKFINCSSDKKLSLIYLILLFVVSIAGTVAAIVLKNRLTF